jgi:hypothetical protein
MKDNQLAKILNAMLVTVIAILIVMSILALAVIHLTFFDKQIYTSSFTPTGINNYLNGLGEYKALFTATVATIAAYFGLLRFKAAADQNRDKLKMDRFSDWKTVLDVRFIEIEKNDPYMKKEFIRIRYHYFNQLYDMKFNIATKTDLTTIFNTTFKDLVEFFENQNNKNIRMGGTHPTCAHSYSLDAFRYLFLGCVDNSYPEIKVDLDSLYVANLPTDRSIDLDLYNSALQISIATA